MTTIVRPGSGAPDKGFPGWDPKPGATGSAREADTLITIVLDKSGSMEIVRTATIEGFNLFKAEQLEAGPDAVVSLSVFDWEPHQICTTVPLADVMDLDFNTYVPDGCTALYDAVGEAIRRTDELIATKAVAPERVLFAVITDGEENASRRYTQKKIFDMVRAHEKAGWTFVFLGANMDSYAASQTVGVRGASRSRDWGHSEVEMRRNMRVLSHATSRWRGDEVNAAQAPTREFFTLEDEQAGQPGPE